jgi:hypothetical protein
MPAMAGIHDLLCWHEGKSWIPAFAGMTGWVSAESQSFGRLVQASTTFSRTKVSRSASSQGPSAGGMAVAPPPILERSVKASSIQGEGSNAHVP